jgi:hypothetical protein
MFAALAGLVPVIGAIKNAAKNNSAKGGQLAATVRWVHVLMTFLLFPCFPFRKAAGTVVLFARVDRLGP